MLLLQQKGAREGAIPSRWRHGGVLQGINSLQSEAVAQGKALASKVLNWVNVELDRERTGNEGAGEEASAAELLTMVGEVEEEAATAPSASSAPKKGLNRKRRRAFKKEAVEEKPEEMPCRKAHVLRLRLRIRGS